MKVLYHASPVKNLKTIRPKRTLSNDVYIGDYVFATSNIKLAAMYLTTRGNATLMNVETGMPTIVIRNKHKNYLSSDKGGAIYTVPATTFEKTPQVGLEKSEMVSKVAVNPIDKKVYRRSIDAMKELGVTIYFVNDETFKNLIEAKDESIIINSLQPYVYS